MNQLIFLLKTDLEGVSTVQNCPEKRKNMKRATRKGHIIFSVFHFGELKLLPTNSALISSSNVLIRFFSKMWTWYQEKQHNLIIRIKIFLKCPL